MLIPPSGLGQQVVLALRLIGSGDCPPVLQLAQGGYDTHADQAGASASWRQPWLHSPLDWSVCPSVHPSPCWP